jgi:hypothetical protein
VAVVNVQLAGSLADYALVSLGVEERLHLFDGQAIPGRADA